MGHNNISNPDVVKVNQKFTYPKTTKEFQAALQRGKPLYDAWLKTKKVAFKVNRIEADTVAINNLNAKIVKISEELAVKNMTVDKLKACEVEISKKLVIANAEINKLRVQNAEIDTLKIRLAEIEDLRIRDLAVKNALIEKLRIKQLEIDKLKSREPVVITKEKIIYRDATKKKVKKDCRDDSGKAMNCYDPWAE
ncbi:MAG: hypothetical protein CR972_05290 [Candidatus Moraniibacteriota bacterium]|nr:MAG: hypothetical protein CR972_05290 [Candidatus Moranbacteria bacterium]